MGTAHLAAALLACAQGPDRVVLVGGESVRGRVVYEDAERLVVRTGSKERVIERAQVAEAESLLGHWREALSRWQAARADSPVAALDLAAYCRRASLVGEAEVLSLHALALDPESIAAREALGHVRAPAGWMVKRAGKSIAWEQVLRERAKFGSAWEFTTLHWRLRTNMPLADAAAAALELECAYQAVHVLLGQHIELLADLETPLAAQVHADKTSFPQSTRGTAYFDPLAAVLYVDASMGFDRGTLVHEATHQVLDALARRQRDSRGDVPAWLDEGLAEHMRASLAGPRGRLARVAGQFDMSAIRLHALAREPYTLSRVLRLTSGDFLASTRSDLKYAQAYTLVAFLLEGDEGRYRAAFGTYLRSAWAGKGGSGELERALDADLDSIERAWTSWVKERAR